jgi:hypothetical protein
MERVSGDLAVDEVHGRRADEAGDEEVGGTIVDGLRRVELLDGAAVHDGDPVGERHGLDLVMGDIDRRHAKLVLEMLDLRPHGHAELGVKVSTAARP